MPLINSVKKNRLCKYDEYIHSLPRETAHDYTYTSMRKIPFYKSKYSGLLNISVMNRLSTIQGEPSDISMRNEEKTRYSNSSKVLGVKQNKSVDKLDFINSTLPKHMAKTIDLKFVNNNINASQTETSPVGIRQKTISPLKIFQLAQSKFYVGLQNLKTTKQINKRKENQIQINKINSLFNVRSVKMIKKLTANLEENLENLTARCQQSQEKINKKSLKKIQNKVEMAQISDCRDIKKSSNMNKYKLFTAIYPNNEQNSVGLKRIKRLQMDKYENQKQNRNYSLIQTDINNLIEENPITEVRQKKPKHFTSFIHSSLNNNILSLSKEHEIRKLHDKNNILLSDFQQKLKKYQQMLQKTAQIHNVSIAFPQTFTKNERNYFIGKGNNKNLIKQVLKKRWWLGQCQQKKSLSRNSVIWTQLKDKSYWNPQQSPIAPTLHNHFEFNQYLGNKKALYYNMRAYYQSRGENVFSKLPLTFHIKTFRDEAWKQFEKVYRKDEDSVWILKPGENSNRGNGITVHESLASIQKQIESCQKQGRTYILQRYIEKPFLYHKRKFDIRCYMLLVRLNKKLVGYWYSEGYIRTSCYEFTLNDCDNSFVHLTNDAIQVHSNNYGKYQDGNKLSFDHFQKYLDKHYNEKVKNGQDKEYNFGRDILPKLKEICCDAIKASYKQLGKQKSGTPIFELFGLDFMIDENFNPWLIEINTNPCLETSSRVLERIIPQLIDNVFKLSVDVLFPPCNVWTNSSKYFLPKNIEKNNFQLIFDQFQYQKLTKNSDKSVNQGQKCDYLERIGQIQQDNEVYEN